MTKVVVTNTMQTAGRSFKTKVNCGTGNNVFDEAEHLRAHEGAKTQLGLSNANNCG
jgi:hypothetical protein